MSIILFYIYIVIKKTIVFEDVVRKLFGIFLKTDQTKKTSMYPDINKRYANILILFGFYKMLFYCLISNRASKVSKQPVLVFFCNNIFLINNALIIFLTPSF